MNIAKPEGRKPLSYRKAVRVAGSVRLAEWIIRNYDLSRPGLVERKALRRAG